MEDQFTAEKFSQHLNTKFQVNADSSEPIEIELVEVEVWKPQPREQAGMERFSIFFYGSPDAFLPQRTYEVTHSQLGEMLLFLVAIGRDERGYRYESVFNRYVERQD